MPIPVLGIPCINRSDLTLRCIRSIDYPVDRLVVINNGRDQGTIDILAQLSEELDNLTVISPSKNLGVAASWNKIIRDYPEADYWLLIGNDIQMTTGDLAKIDAFVRAHPGYATCPANHGHSMFAVTPVGRDAVGFFDENFFPGFCEDQDWMYRLKLSGLPWSDVPNIHAVHGCAPSFGSHSIYADPELFKANQITHGNNVAYYTRKWLGRPGEEKATHPFGLEDWPITKWEIDQGHLSANELTIKESRSDFLRSTTLH